MAGASFEISAVFSSIPAAIAAAQASPVKGSGLSAFLFGKVATATDCDSAATTNSGCSTAGAQLDEKLLAGEAPWKASSRQSGAACDGSAGCPTGSSRPL